MKSSLNLLFLTNFEDPCYQVIPAISHLAGRVRTNLTILHAYEDEQDRAEVEGDIKSFFAEADHYAGCRRVTVQGELVSVVEHYCRTNEVDLLVAPAGERLSLPILPSRSTRAGLLERVPVPLWTMTTRVDDRNRFKSIDRVACYVDLERPDTGHLEAAASFATSLGAQLHLLHVVPEIHEGSLGVGWPNQRPLSPDVAEERLFFLMASHRRTAEIHGASARRRPSCRNCWSVAARTSCSSAKAKRCGATCCERPDAALAAAPAVSGDLPRWRGPACPQWQPSCCSPRPRAEV